MGETRWGGGLSRARWRARLDAGAGRRRYLALLLKPLGKRLAYNVPDERLVALARAAPELRDPHRAKALAEAGYRTPADIASASPEAIARVLLDKEPFELRAGAPRGRAGEVCALVASHRTEHHAGVRCEPRAAWTRRRPDLRRVPSAAAIAAFSLENAR